MSKSITSQETRSRGATHITSSSQESGRSDDSNVPATLAEMLGRHLDSGAVLDPSDVTYGRMVGSGSTAEVFEGTFGSKPVAIKRIMKTFQCMTGKEARELSRELAILKSVSHPSLVYCYGVLPTDPVEILTEYCAGGTCFALFHEGCEGCDANSEADDEAETELTWAQKLQIFVDTAEGMSYLHGLMPQIIHRDLKSLNMLLVEALKDASQVPRVKLCDFGIARLKDHEDVQMTKDVGTYNWIAPEVLSNSIYDEKVDVYSFGMILFEGSSGELPFEDEEDGWEIIRRVKGGERPDLEALPPDCPKHLQKLLVACWAQDPKLRPDFQQILRDLAKIKSKYT
mmetsp:Transcript_78686/g.208843  ORF Transcript_78686/g.208843 Transcript_78686/m.208843 type:complete len:342 (-) Transcript_78686:61-1086(-)